MNNKYLLIDGCDNIEINEIEQAVSLKCVIATCLFDREGSLYRALLNTKSFDTTWVNDSTFDLRLKFAN